MNERRGCVVAPFAGRCYIGVVRSLVLVLHRLASLSALAFSAATAVDYYGSSPRFCQSGAGCEVVHAWSTGFRLDLVLPALGLVFYTVVLGLSLAPSAKARRLGALAGAFGSLGAIAFLTLQGVYIGAWCWLCVGVDTSAIVVGLTGLVLLRTPTEAASLRSPWWSAWALAIGLPLAWGFTSPPSPIPDVVRARYVDGSVNVVLLSDPECPFCRRMHPILEEAIAEAREGGASVHVDRVLVPLPFHRLAREASRAILCAGEHADAMTTNIYEGRLERPAILEYVRALPIDERAFVQCLDAPETDARIEENLAFAEAAGMQGLPTTYIEGRTILGFDARAGIAPFREALAAADGPSERPWWPFAGLALVALALASWARPRRAG